MKPQAFLETWYLHQNPFSDCVQEGSWEKKNAFHSSLISKELRKRCIRSRPFAPCLSKYIFPYINQWCKLFRRVFKQRYSRKETRGRKQKGSKCRWRAGADWRSCREILDLRPPVLPGKKEPHLQKLNQPQQGFHFSKDWMVFQWKVEKENHCFLLLHCKHQFQTLNKHFF